MAKSHLRILIDERIKLEQSIYKQQKRLKKLNTMIELFANEERKKTAVNWTKKAIECLERNDKVMLTTEILSDIFSNKKDDLEENRRGYLVGLSVALNNLCINRTLNKIIVSGVKGHFYGLSSWFTKEGYLTPKYHQKLTNQIVKKNVPRKITIKK